MGIATVPVSTSKNLNGFAVQMYKMLSEKNSGNLFFSPKNILDVLAMVYIGARNETKKEIQEICGFPDNTEEFVKDLAYDNYSLTHIRDCVVNIANGLYPQKDYPFDADFISNLKRKLGVEFNAVDYTNKSNYADIVRQVNGWVEEKTEDKIKNLISEDFISEDTRLILVAAIYFLGKWEKEFNKYDTKEKKFYVTREQNVDVAMMNRTGKFNYYESDSLQALEIPYKGNDLVMNIFLPREQSQRVIVDSTNLAKIQRRMEYVEVKVSIPKWKVTSKFDLGAMLQQMGIKQAFSDGADFSGMIKDGTKEAAVGLKISQVLHQAFVDVTEKGTEAAAATAAGMCLRGFSIPAEPKIFNANHPFLYTIMDKRNNNILFMGRVTDPTLSK